MTRTSNTGGQARGPDAPLIRPFRGLVCDLDGVVYLGPRPVPHAVEALNEAIGLGVAPVFATNSAARSPAEVATQLRRLGIPVTDHNVVTSAQAGAGHLAGVLPPGARVLAVGGPGVPWALAEAGLQVVSRPQAAAGPSVAAVLQGLGTDVSWADLAEVALAVQRGALWVATNRDLTVPTDRGLCPGNGALISAVVPAAGGAPVITGKPEPLMYRLCATRLGVGDEEILTIGDRLDTDIAGANRGGLASMLVLTGVTGVADLILADGERRPRFLVTDLRALHRPYLSASVSASSRPAHPVEVGAAAGGGRARGSGGPDVGSDVGSDGDTLAYASAECGTARVIVLRDGDIRCASTPVGAPARHAADQGAADHPGPAGHTEPADHTEQADQRLRAIVAAAWAARDAGWVPSTSALARLTQWYDEARQGGSG